jgi:CheY-like chemotaxis protein
MAMIVIAEDEYLLADLLASFLEDEGHEVATAPNGLGALELIRERRPALIITDFMMPLMTGLELAQAVRADAMIADIPIVLVSGAQGAIGRAHPEAFNAVLDKPYALPTLLEVVKELTAY